ncbi:hypothetical protein HZB74_03245 [Candidatus Saccharibacteria bacterium]|nr:hypothetical protein [Candidatus Saccharibacteria bacterium]
MNTNLALARQEIAGLESSRPRLTLIEGGHFTPTTERSEVPEIPDVINVSELPDDAEITAEARRKVKSQPVGSLAVAETVECKAKPIINLLEGIQWAAEGDEDGDRMVEANVSTEAVEQSYKVNVNKVVLEVNTDGSISQHGNYMDDVQHNAYQLASNDEIIVPRTLAEVNNNARLKWAREKGLLKTHIFLTFSLCAEGESDKRLDELKFFSKTKSLSAQGSYENDEGKLVLDTAMIAGVAEEGDERHDRKMVEGFGRKIGVNFEGMSASEIIDCPVLIPKERFKNGIIDVAKILDEINGGTFMGQKVSEEDRMSYEEYRDFCAQRAENLGDTIRKVKQQLISEVASFEKPLQAARRLSKLVEQNLVNRALDDESIDPSVFGPKSAPNLIRARELRAEGNYHEAQAFMQVALATAQGGSCPTALNKELLKAFSITDPAQSESEISKENAWAGTEDPVEGTCVNCEKKTKVGVKNWCKGCIKGHCG